MRAADIVLFATPIQWGVEASPMRRCLERMDALEEEYRKTGLSPIYNKVAGIVIVGSEDSAKHTNGNLLNVLQFQGFTFPPEACCYWVGTVGDDSAGDGERRRANRATPRPWRSGWRATWLSTCASSRSIRSFWSHTPRPPAARDMDSVVAPSSSTRPPRAR